MRKWDEYERELDDNYDVCNNDDCTQECEEFRDDDFVSVRVNISFYLCGVEGWSAKTPCASGEM